MNDGEKLGEILRHAAAKEAEVRDYYERIARAREPKEIKRLANELDIQLAKCYLRVSEAESVVGAGITVRVTQLDGEPVIEGVLKSVDTEQGSMKIKAGSTRLKTLTYATNVPVPDDLAAEGQTYFGTRLSLEFEVVSIPIGNEWVLQ